MNLKMVPLTDLKVDPAFNFRRRITKDSLRSLIRTIEKYGQQAPVLVDVDYNLVAGFRRCRALTEMGRTHVWAIVTDLPLRQAKILNLIENTERVQLNLVEEAWAVREIYQDPMSEFCEEIGRPAGWVSFRLAVTTLHAKIIKAIETDQITESQVRQLVQTKTQNQQFKLLTQFTKAVPTPPKYTRGVRSKKEVGQLLVAAAKADWSDRELKLIRWLEGKYDTVKLMKLIEDEPFQNYKLAHPYTVDQDETRHANQRNPSA